MGPLRRGDPEPRCTEKRSLQRKERRECHESQLLLKQAMLFISLYSLQLQFFKMKCVHYWAKGAVWRCNWQYIENCWNHVLELRVAPLIIKHPNGNLVVVQRESSSLETGFHYWIAFRLEENILNFWQIILKILTHGIHYTTYNPNHLLFCTFLSMLLEPPTSPTGVKSCGIMRLGSRALWELIHLSNSFTHWMGDDVPSSTWGTLEVSIWSDVFYNAFFFDTGSCHF